MTKKAAELQPGDVIKTSRGPLKISRIQSRYWLSGEMVVAVFRGEDDKPARFFPPERNIELSPGPFWVHVAIELPGEFSDYGVAAALGEAVTAFTRDKYPGADVTAEVREVPDSI